MSVKQSHVIRGNHDFTDRSPPKKYSHHFMPRPQTINPAKNSQLEKGSSLDVINTKRSTARLDRTEIVFKRDKFLYESKYNNIAKNSQHEEDRKASHTLTPLYNHKLDLASDNLRMTISKYQNLMESNNDVMKNVVREEILS